MKQALRQSCFATARTSVASRRQERQMMMFRALGAVALWSVTIATPVVAQEVIQEPGAFAFYHPYGDLRIGSPPAANAMAFGPIRETRHVAGASMPAKMHPPARRASYRGNY
jgi:hypothetical protein